jgi:Glycosyl transferases group 1
MKIIYISERFHLSKTNGATLRDVNLVNALQKFCAVEVLKITDARCHSNIERLARNRKLSNAITERLAQPDYDHLIISTFPISPYIKAYSKLQVEKYFYLCDSSFHIKKQLNNLKHRLLLSILCNSEAHMLKSGRCIYLGQDEVDTIPNKYRDNALICPFAKKYDRVLFDENGPSLLFGDFGFTPNLKMLEFIYKNQHFLPWECRVAGINIPERFKTTNQIKIVGAVTSPQDAFVGTSCLLYPINYGTGIKNKVLEAFSFGVPVVGFPGAFTNIPKENQPFWVCNPEEDYFEQLAQCLPNLKSLSKKCQLYLEENFSEYSVDVTLRGIFNAQG